MSMSRVAVAVLATVLAALLGSADGAAVSTQGTMLFGEVGPEFEISLRDAQGNRLTTIDPGTYTIHVEDKSDFHNFRLVGPGVDERTDVAFTGEVTWTVTFRNGTYVYHCDPHPLLRGELVSGTPQTTPPPSNVVRPGTRLVLTSGPRFSITLKTAAGKAVKQLRVGTYRVSVRDRSRIHNARLRAPGYNHATTLRFVGTQTWTVRLRRSGTLRFLCDPHAAAGMRGSARVVASG
jgi:plastocyanin